jgi:hypothetical protein
MRGPPNGEDHQALRKAKRGNRRMKRMKMRSLPSRPNVEDHQALRKAKRGNRRMHQLKVKKPR